MYRTVRVALAVWCAVVGGGAAACGRGQPEDAAAEAAEGSRADASGAPMTFRGTVPCADCPGIEITVTLLSDGTFRLRQRYLDRDPLTTWFDLGRWSEAEGGRLALRGKGEGPMWLARFAWDSLRMLDGDGQEIPSDLPFGLARAAEVDPVEDVQPLQGMVTHAAGTLVFAECLTGTTFPVSRSGAYAELERALVEGILEPGRPLLVRVRGRLTGGSGDGAAPSLVVHTVDGAEPGAGCGEAVADLSLEGTRWTLVELEGVPVPEGVRVTLVLDGAGRHASGSGGCSPFAGSYRLEGASLTFGDLAITRASCALPAAEVELAYLRTLGRVGGYRLTGDGLDLLAEEGVVARFRSS
ncbi:MAG: META domain-containing protein [Longimicrobiales bacterium]